MTTTFTDPGRAQQGVRDLRRDRRQRRRDRADPRRRADRDAQLALQHVRQPGLRRHRDRRRAPAAAQPGARGQAQARHPGRAERLGRPVPARVRLLARADDELATAPALGS